MRFSAGTPSFSQRFLLVANSILMVLTIAALGCSKSSPPVAESATSSAFDDREPADVESFAMQSQGMQAPVMATEEIQPSMAAASPSDSFPAGATASGEEGFATIAVYYATDRAPNPIPLSAYELTGARMPVYALVVVAAVLGFVAVGSIMRRDPRGARSRIGALSAIGSMGAGGMAMVIMNMGMATIEKHGVTYTGNRGLLKRGVATVTVPDSHQRGEVERPSLLRFEFREDQRKHVVMTAADELDADEFYRRMSDTVSETTDKELLVFIHGFNVDFDSAIRRTAQLAVDLPFRGVPVCYSWPSQGELLGYTIDENNVAWTVHHLKTILYELSERSGATSINLIAHSMGNRALTSALSEISYEINSQTMDEDTQSAMFDRVVLAAPDVDADTFRRDLAPRLLKTSNNVTLYASSDDNALIASKQVHGYPRAGESGPQIVIVPGIETIDVTGIDLSLLGHSYYGDNGNMLSDLYELVTDRLPASQRQFLQPQQSGSLTYWRLLSDGIASRIAAPVR